MAWIRKIEMSIGTAGRGLLISDLNLTFDIQRSSELSDNSGNFTIYNAKENTRKNVLKTGNNIIFKAGYEDEKNISTIFIGTISKVVSEKQGVDWVTEIESSDIASNRVGLLYGTIDLSYKSKTPLLSVINDIGTFLGIPVFGIENVISILNNGLNYSGNISNLLDLLKNMLSNDGLKLYFDSGEMVIYREGIPNTKFGIVSLTPSSGLIGEVAEINNENNQDSKKRIGFKSLLNPEIKPNSVLNIMSNKVNGSFIVEKITFNGDNFGGDFICEGEAVS